MKCIRTLWWTLRLQGMFVIRESNAVVELEASLRGGNVFGAGFHRIEDILNGQVDVSQAKSAYLFSI